MADDERGTADLAADRIKADYLRPATYAEPTDVYAGARQYLGSGYTDETQHAFAMWVLDHRYDRETGWCPSLAQCWLDWSDARLGIVR